jgi:hypothetical protein
VRCRGSASPSSQAVVREHVAQHLHHRLRGRLDAADEQSGDVGDQTSVVEDELRRELQAEQASEDVGCNVGRGPTRLHAALDLSAPTVDQLLEVLTHLDAGPDRGLVEHRVPAQVAEHVDLDVARPPAPRLVVGTDEAEVVAAQAQRYGPGPPRRPGPPDPEPSRRRGPRR